MTDDQVVEQRLRSLLHDETPEDHGWRSASPAVVAKGIRRGRARRVRQRLVAAGAVLLLVTGVPIAWTRLLAGTEPSPRPPAHPAPQVSLSDSGSVPVQAQALAASRNLLVTDSGDGRVQIWRVGDSSRAVRVASFSAGKDTSVRAMAVDPSGTLLALGVVPVVQYSPQGEVISGRKEDASLQLWSLRTGSAPRKVFTTRLHGRSISDLTMSRDGRLLVTAGSDGAVRFWHLGRDTATAAGAIPVGEKEGYLQVALSPDGRRLAVASLPGLDPAPSTVSLWDIGDPSRPVGRGRIPITDAGGSVAFTSDGRSVLIGSDVLSLWSFDDSRPRTRLGILHAASASSSATDPVAPLAAVSLPFGSLTLFDIRDPLRPRVVSQVPSPQTQPVFSADGRWLAVLAETGVRVLRLR